VALRTAEASYDARRNLRPAPARVCAQTLAARTTAGVVRRSPGRMAARNPNNLELNDLIEQELLVRERVVARAHC
jgi:hypothetical protein